MVVKHFRGRVNMSYIKQLIEKYSLPAKRTVAVGLVAFCTLSSLTACGDIANEIIDTNGTKITETSGDINFTESGNNQTGNQSGNQTETNQSNNQNETNQSTSNPTGSDITNVEDRFAHSATYNRAKQKWAHVWNAGVDRASEIGFLTKAAPFKFLSQQGVVYYNEQGEPRAYGTDDNFDNELCIQSKAWIDPSTSENDFYLLTQYISAPIDDSNSNDDTYVATYMLKYTVADDCYRDLLLSAGTLRGNLLIRQIDQEYIPEIISKSVIGYDLIDSLGLFRKLENGGDEQLTLNYYKKDVANYVESIDIPNMQITVNYNTNDNKGDIYSYTYSLKETYSWDAMLKGNLSSVAVSKEYRDSLTPEQIMLTNSTLAGPALVYTAVDAWVLNPSSKQKATASIKYDFVNLAVDASATGKTLDEYEAGKISYAEVNSLTRDYVNSLKSGLTK